MEAKFEEQLQLIPADDLALRIGRVTDIMREQGLDALLLCDNADIFYLTGRVFCGFIYVGRNGDLRYFVRRPSTLRGDGIRHISKVEEIPAEVPAPTALGLEVDTMPYSRVGRILKAFGLDRAGNASDVMRRARAVKTPLEIRQIEMSGIKQTKVYRDIPHLYIEGMSDVEFQIEIERALRLEGCLGQFRVTGPDLELYMGNILTGDNADRPSPYDFAMGGAGMSPSLPVGADGTVIRPGKPVMVDINGNFTGYMTDMTRCFIVGDIPDEAARANDLSRRICARLQEMARPGTHASELYDAAVELAYEAGMADYFMGHRYHAPFVGHGLGISINELPVLSHRSRDVLAEGNAIAVEPKFVIPGVGAVGIENTYIIEKEATRCLTLAPEQIVSLM